jgi:hypothetical protein
MPSRDGKHEPNVGSIKISFEVEDNQEQVYVTTPCTCGDENCVWSAGAIMYRYDTRGEDAKEDG